MSKYGSSMNPGTMEAVPHPNPTVKSFSEKLERLKKWMNQSSIPDSIPFIGGEKYGDYILADSPGYIGRQSDKFSQFEGGGLNTRLNLEPEQGLLDTILLGLPATAIGGKFASKAAMKQKPSLDDLIVTEDRDLPQMLRRQSGDGRPEMDYDTNPPEFLNRPRDAFLPEDYFTNPPEKNYLSLEEWLLKHE